MENRKYQIFVSSTYEDLKEERKAIIEYISKLGHLPIGMELFIASNDEQFKYIQKTIDNCDYYILILGGRYGSISPNTHISYTEMEFDYACRKNIPILVFPYRNIDSLPSNKRDCDLTNIKNFITKATKSRLANFWEEEKNLIANVIVALQDQFSTNPQRGWIRPDEVNNSKLLEELNEVRKEKEILIDKLQKLEKTQNNCHSLYENIAEMDEFYTINYSYKTNDPYCNDYEEDSVDLTWNEIFSCVGAFYISPYFENSFSTSLEVYLSERLSDVSHIKIHSKDIDTIKIQFMALQLIETETIKNSEGYNEYYLKLTNKGFNYLTKIKTVKTKKNKNIVT